MFINILKRLLYRDVETDFKKIVSVGGLEKFRDVLEEASKNYFVGANGSHITLTSKNRAQQSLSAVQRLVIIFYSPLNLYAFVAQQCQKPFLFVLPANVALKFKISTLLALLSNILFIMFLINLSLFRFIKASLTLFKVVDNLSCRVSSTSIYIQGITDEALSNKNGKNKAHNLENWLRKYYLKPNSLIFHSVDSLRSNDNPDNVYVKTFLPALAFNKKLFIFLLSVARLCAAIFAAFFGRWHMLMIIDDWMYAQVFLKAKRSDIHNKYIFPFQGNQYRPYWSWIAEKKGASIVQLHYAAAISPSLDNKLRDRVHLSTSTWTEIIPFNYNFSSSIKKLIGNNKSSPKILELPSVNFVDDYNKILPRVSQPIMAIFDNAPLLERYHIGWMDNHDYMDGDDIDPIYVNRKFFLDSLSVANSYGLKLATKQKRVDHRVKPEYRMLLDELEADGDLVIFPPSIAASRLVELSIISIALPFTSVGYFTDVNPNLCFYDPINKLCSEHEGRLNVPLNTGLDKLQSWVGKIIEKE